MALPEGVTTCTVTAGVPVTHTGAPVKAFVSIEPSVFLVHTATGTPLVDFLEELSINEGVAGQFTLPHTDQAGFQDENGNAYTNWYYTARISYSTPSKAKTKAPKIKVFQLVAGQTIVDLDALPGGAPALPYTAPIATVTSLNGRTGPVTVTDADLPERLSDESLSATILAQNPTTGKAATIPAALGWDASYPLAINLTDLPGTSRSFGAVDKTPEQLFDAASTARTAPANTFYVSGTGVNTNNGLTSGTAVRSIWKAVELANATGQPAKIIVAAGKYIRSHNIWTSGATGYPTVDLALIADGGRVVTGSFDDAGTPTVDATHTNTYSWAVANCNKVVDMANLNRYGNYTELVKVNTAAECNVIPNSWALVGGTLYVNRADRQAVTTATTRIYRPASNGLALRKAINFYMGGTTGNDGWDIEGGNNIGVFDITVNPANNPYAGKFVCVVKNSTFKYGGGITDTITRAVSVEGWNGLAAFFNCRADAAQTDGFNFHNVYAAASMNILTVNCTGYDNGRYPQPSCNGYTLHEDVKGIDIAGHYKDSRGGTVRNINASKMLAVGTWADGDFGDVPHGGSVPPTAYRMDDTAQLWADRTKATGAAGGYGYVTGTATASVHRKSAWPTPAPDSGVGTFDTYA